MLEPPLLWRKKAEQSILCWITVFILLISITLPELQKQARYSCLKKSLKENSLLLASEVFLEAGGDINGSSCMVIARAPQQTYCQSTDNKHIGIPGQGWTDWEIIQGELEEKLILEGDNWKKGEPCCCLFFRKIEKMLSAELSIFSALFREKWMTHIIHPFSRKKVGNWFSTRVESGEWLLSRAQNSASWPYAAFTGKPGHQ